MNLLIDALYCPQRLRQLRPEQWDILIRQARRGDLLARMSAAAHDTGCWGSIPAQVQMHLQSALNLAIRQQQELRWEVDHIADALKDVDVPVVLLKGAAYVLARSAVARGRLVSDVDILVSRAALPAVEKALMMGGWVSNAKSAYDQVYYREWMHELPPMQHFKRGTTIDVHHAILPLSARLHPSTDKLLKATVLIAPNRQVHVLSPLDRVLHSASHLFHEGDLEKGLHGLVDIDLLLRESSAAPDFWLQLIGRAIELELTRPLFYALRYARMVLDSPIPSATVSQLDAAPHARPSPPLLLLMDALYLRALRPPHPTLSDRWTPFARWLLYVRGHWLRMPPWLLIQHLSRKIWLAWFPDKKD
ncbi:nucleotidyltransferase domain-containing protein [Rhodoferax fermentans]|uniref:Nucleotidyltransferase n=1 Tax=Rhodoferax fermentans TaxID=28066 RepID=A0A1T1AY67_RHOFE|nr:nucleotidyltransferase family protein [Rhodoferax fermentans]MBK1682295.1 hypothetical protein [Rhodoferax fermentans]OOV09076.1 hypothetical protein RF819_11395 [Rhodoferax fermentans]